MGSHSAVDIEQQEDFGSGQEQASVFSRRGCSPPASWVLSPSPSPCSSDNGAEKTTVFPSRSPWWQRSPGSLSGRSPYIRDPPIYSWNGFGTRTSGGLSDSIPDPWDSTWH